MCVGMYLLLVPFFVLSSPIALVRSQQLFSKSHLAHKEMTFERMHNYAPVGLLYRTRHPAGAGHYAGVCLVTPECRVYTVSIQMGTV